MLHAAALPPRLQWAHGHCRQIVNANKVYVIAIYLFSNQVPQGYVCSADGQRDERWV